MANDNLPPNDVPTPPIDTVITPSNAAPSNTPVNSNVTLGGDAIVVPHKAFEGIKKEARAHGAKEATAKLETKAKELGFDSVEAAFAAAVASKKVTEPVTPPAPAVPPPVSATPPNDVPSRYAVELAAANAAAESAKAAAQAANEAATLASANADVKVMLVTNGVKEVDFVTHQLGAHMSTLTPEQASAFKPEDWLTALKAEKPYLFSVTSQVPANTLPPVGTPVPTPSASQIAGSTGPKLASELSKDEFAAKLRSYGVTPTVGM